MRGFFLPCLLFCRGNVYRGCDSQKHSLKCNLLDCLRDKYQKNKLHKSACATAAVVITILNVII
uniref:Uncharacterized protein n=1 Tax=Anguilla anguilla TaxID=7936 RepID=A0A0E9V3I1_ANGAN